MADRKKLDISEEDFPGNSSYSSIRAPGRVRKVSSSGAIEDPEPEKVLDGDIKPEKKGLMKRIADAFIAVDGKDIKNYLIFDVLIPGLKRGAEDMLHMALYNDKKPDRVTRSRGTSSIRRLEYSSIRPARDDDDVMLNRKTIAGSTDLVFPTRDKAEEALDMVYERIKACGFATLKYYYTITRQPTEWPQEKWCWRSTEGATIVQCRGGYVLKMPRLEEI
jgi:hypothetical protein